MAQSRRPEQVVVIDQSEAADHRAILSHMAAAAQAGLAIEAEWRPGLSGAAAARNCGLARAQGKILVFLDDDDELEMDFLAALARAYENDPMAAGFAGFITNFPRPSLYRRGWSWVFERGVFRDDRYQAYRGKNPSQPRYRLTRMTGNAMSFRRAWLGGLRFEEVITGAGVEDVEICMRLPRAAQLWLTPQARLRHAKTATARPREPWLWQQARADSFLYYRHWRGRLSRTIAFYWLNAGWAVWALAAAGTHHSWASLRHWRAGVEQARDWAAQVSSTPLRAF